MKYLSILRYILLVLSVLVVAFYFINGVENDVDAMFGFTFALLAGSVGLAIILPVLNFAKNPQGAVRSLLGIVIVAVILGIAYSMSDATPVVTASKTFDNEMELRLSDTGLYTTYIAFGAAIASIVLLEVYNMFK